MTSTTLVPGTKNPPSRPVCRRLDPASHELMPARTWGLLRDALQHRLERHERARTVPLGPSMRLRFEDEVTLRTALQDALDVDGPADDAILRERVAASARLLPDGGDWRATLVVDMSDRQPATAVGPSLLHAAARQVSLQVGIIRIDATDCGEDADLPDMYLGGSSSTHLVRFALPPAVRDAVRAGTGAALLCTHPFYSWRHRLPDATLRVLLRDLDPPPASATRRAVVRRPSARTGHAHALST